jgi:hypothetical protein
MPYLSIRENLRTFAFIRVEKKERKWARMKREWPQMPD